MATNPNKGAYDMTFSKELIEGKTGRADSRYCDKCGQRFEAHNDDGSCVDDDYETQLAVDDFFAGYVQD